MAGQVLTASGAGCVSAGTWLAARLAFTRTNAAWAMVGHVLGLGDRHGENIMIDGLTGQLQSLQH